MSAAVRTPALPYAARDPRERALAVCLDVLVRMDPAAVAAGQLSQCSDREFNQAVAAAAGVMWGKDRQSWPPVVHALLTRKELDL